MFLRYLLSSFSMIFLCKPQSFFRTLNLSRIVFLACVTLLHKIGDHLLRTTATESNNLIIDNCFYKKNYDFCSRNEYNKILYAEFSYCSFSSKPRSGISRSRPVQSQFHCSISYWSNHIFIIYNSGNKVCHKPIASRHLIKDRGILGYIRNQSLVKSYVLYWRWLFICRLVTVNESQTVTRIASVALSLLLLQDCFMAYLLSR